MSGAPVSGVSTLRVERNGDVLDVRLHRPEARNAVSLQMCQEMLALFGSLASGSEARVVTLRGAGPAFCAGVDIRELASQDAAWVAHRRSLGLDVYLAIERCPLPVICAVHGAVIGAGCELAAACDFVLAAQDAFFQWPEALRGTVGATQRLPRIVGRAMAKELLFTARRISAQEAKAIGFVNHVCDAAGLEEALRVRIEEIRACGPVALRLMKQAIHMGEGLDRTTAADVERRIIEQSLAHEEWRRGVADFAPRKCQ